MTSNLLTMLQLCDSAFPTGGFSHSMGAESAIAHMYVGNKENLKTFVIGTLENLGSFSLPFVKAAYNNYSNLDELCPLMKLLDVSLTNHVAKRSSLQQGETLLNSSCESFNETILKDLQKLVDEEKIYSHQAVVFGVVCSCLQLEETKSLEMFMFNGLRTIIASLVRLGKLGAMEAQRWQFEMQDCLTDIINRNIQLKPSDAALTFPTNDVLQMSHDLLFSKLFIS